MKSICISAISSNQGKTLLSTALLWHYKKKASPFKVGPDYIDTQFHEKVCGNPSINLDTFMMSEDQIKWLFKKYGANQISIIEGVMGFYDGEDKNCSTYGVAKTLNTPTILVLDCSGTYITISAVLKGLLEYKNDNTIKAVVLNKISSKSHYELIKNIIEKDHDGITVLGYIEKLNNPIESRHLGLDLNDIEKLDLICPEVLKNIDIKALETVANTNFNYQSDYPFEIHKKQNKKLAIVKDENFSFIYHDNIEFLKEVFSEVVFIDSTKNEVIPDDAHAVYICGGYVETDDAYAKIKDANSFKNSLIAHSKKGYIYAECAGLLYLGKRVDNKIMSGILDIEFNLGDKRERLGYYYSSNNSCGHAFHYTKTENINGMHILSKAKNASGKIGAWQNGKIYGTYIHTTFRNNFNILREYFGI